MRCPLVPHGAVLQPSSVKSLPGKTNRKASVCFLVKVGLNQSNLLRTRILEGPIQNPDSMQGQA